MAERRMFAKTIIDSDAFIDMPVTARLLYYDLGMRADDEGFVNAPKKIMRMVGASQDDLSILIAKKFIIPFDSGLVVIKHWRIHNYIQKDRFKPTKYTEEREQLELKPSGAYTMYTDCIQDVSNMDPQVRLGKVRLGKDSIGNTMAENDPSSGKPDGSVQVLDPVESWFTLFWKAYPRKVKKPDAFKAFKQKCRKSEDFDLIMNGLQKWSKAWKDPQFIPYPATWIRNEQYNDEPPRTKEERLLF